MAATAFGDPLTLSDLYKHIETEEEEVCDEFKFDKNDKGDIPTEIKEKLHGQYYHQILINAYDKVGIDYFDQELFTFNRMEVVAIAEFSSPSKLLDKLKPNFKDLCVPREDDPSSLQYLKSTMNKLIKFLDDLK